MNKKEIEEKIHALYEKKTGLNVPDPQSAFRDLDGWDSLRFAMFVIALQDEFDVRLAPHEIAALENLSAAVEIIANKV